MEFDEKSLQCKDDKTDNNVIIQRSEVTLKISSQNKAKRTRNQHSVKKKVSIPFYLQSVDLLEDDAKKIASRIGKKGSIFSIFSWTLKDFEDLKIFDPQFVFNIFQSLHTFYSFVDITYPEVKYTKYFGIHDTSTSLCLRFIEISKEKAIKFYNFESNGDYETFKGIVHLVFEQKTREFKDICREVGDNHERPKPMLFYIPAGSLYQEKVISWKVLLRLEGKTNHFKFVNWCMVVSILLLITSIVNCTLFPGKDVCADPNLCSVFCKAPFFLLIFFLSCMLLELQWYGELVPDPKGKIYQILYVSNAISLSLSFLFILFSLDIYARYVDALFFFSSLISFIYYLKSVF